MYKLHMADGTTKEVSYEQARSIKSMLDGVTFPKDDKQRAFLNQVASVEMTAPKPVLERGKPSQPKDPNLQKLLKTTKLKGIDKTRAIALYIKTKQLPEGV